MCLDRKHFQLKPSFVKKASKLDSYLLQVPRKKIKKVPQIKTQYLIVMVSKRI